MSVSAPTLLEQAVHFSAALLLFTSFLLLAQSRLLSMIRVFACQGFLLGIITALVAVVSKRNELIISAVMTLVLKALFIPALLRRLMLRLNVKREVETVANRVMILLWASGLVVFSYYVSIPITELAFSTARNVIPVSLAVVLLGHLLMTAYRKAVTQVIGFMCVENGVFFAGVVATYGMPFIVEIGIAFDVLVAAILFGIFFFQIRDTFESLDVDRLSRLREVE